MVINLDQRLQINIEEMLYLGMFKNFKYLGVVLNK